MQSSLACNYQPYLFERHYLLVIGNVFTLSISKIPSYADQMSTLFSQTTDQHHVPEKHQAGVTLCFGYLHVEISLNSSHNRYLTNVSDATRSFAITYPSYCPSTDMKRSCQPMQMYSHTVATRAACNYFEIILKWHLTSAPTEQRAYTRLQ